MNEVFSTRDMARLCGVNESTIKRWSDSGRLRCVKTPGGHRKFLIRDVLGFLNEYGFEGLGVEEENPDGRPDSTIAVRILRRDWPGLAQACLETALRNTPSEVVQFIFRCATGGCSLIEICDRIIGPALTELGDRWERGGVSILQEHLAAAATIHALNRLGDTMPRHDPIGATAICAPAEGECHEIGARMAALVLESLGWTTRLVISPMPLSELVRAITQYRPQLICISVVTTPVGPGWREHYEDLWKTSRSAGTQLAIGGRGATDLIDMPADLRAQNLASLDAYSRGLIARRGAVPSR